MVSAKQPAERSSIRVNKGHKRTGEELVHCWRTKKRTSSRLPGERGACKKSSSKGKHKKSRKGKKPLAAQPLPPPSITAVPPASSASAASSSPSSNASSFVAVASTQLLRTSAPSSAGTERIITSLQQTMSTVAVAAQQHSTESRTHSLNLAEHQTAGSTGALSVENGHSSGMLCAPCPSNGSTLAGISPESTATTVPGCGGGGVGSNSASSSSSSVGHAMADSQTDTSGPSVGGDGQQQQMHQQQQQQLVDSSQQQQDQPAAPGSRPTSSGRQQRIAGGKGKHLTRSHAMRESTSPPRTPTPRSPSDTHNSNPISSAGSGSTGGITNTTTATTTVASSSSSSGNALSNGPQSPQERSTGAASTMNDVESLAKHNSSGLGGGGLSGTSGGNSGNSSPNIVLFAGGEDQQRNGKSQLDLDFPKLTPPKTSFNPNAGSNGAHHPHSQKGNSVKSNGTAIHHARANGSAGSETDKSAPLTTTAGTTISVASGGSNNAKQTTPSQQSVTSTVSANATGTDTPDGGGTTRGGGMAAGQSPSNHNLVPVSGSGSVSAVTCDTTVGGDPSIPGAAVGKALSTHTTSVQSAASSNFCDNDGRHGLYQHQHQQRDVSFSSNEGASGPVTNADGQINIQFSHETETHYIQCDSPTDSLMRSGGNAGPTTTPPSGGSGGSGGKKRSGASGKGGNKATRLKNLSGGSSSSVDGGGGPGGGGGGSGSCGGGMASFMSRDSLCDPFTDQSGVNLLQFFKETLNKNFKDRNMLMKIEKELLSLAMDRSRSQMKFPPMSSYNRMLIHRVAAYFGMEHNVDATQQCVIAEVTPATRIPDIRFKNLISDSFSEEPRKSILKRDTHSFDEYHRFGSGGGGGGGGGGSGSGSGLLHCPDRGMLDRKAKSFEEREEEYEKSKRRLFKNRESIEGRSDERPCVSKSHSFGGYGGSSQNASLLRGDSITSTKSAGARLFTKQDSNASTNTPWRLSPSSSGSYLTSSYKTQSIRSDSVTPSPTGYGSGDHTPEPCVPSPSATCGVMWAVTDMASVPKGSVLIDPQTFQPIVNQDGSLYHFDPSNLPPAAGGPWPASGKISKRRFEKQKSFNSKNNLNSSSSLESTTDGPSLGKTVECGQQTAIPAVGENGSGAITTIMTVVSATATTTPTTIAEEVVNELGCYDVGVNSGGLKLLNVKDNPDMDENSSLCEEISQTTNELGGLKLQKHQATSPMLQASELQPIDMNEIQYGTNQHESGTLMHTANTALLESDRSLIDEVVETTGEEQDDLGDTLDTLDKPDHNNAALGAAVQLLHVHDPVSSSSTLDAGEDDEDRSETPTDGGQEEVDKKNDMVKVANVVQTVVPLTSYASTTTTPNGGSSIGGGGVSAYTVTYDGGGSGHPGATVYATGTPGLSTTTYQTAPDGAIYAVPSSLVYTYPTTMDPTEMAGGYFVPVYDPQQQRESSLCSTPGASIYSAPAGATSTVLHPIAYTQSAAAAAAAAAAAYTGAPLYQNPVMYSSDQFPAAQAAAAAAAGQLSQYPITYPIGIGYPFNGAAYQNYWNQPITYYVPQTPVPSTVGGASILMQPPIPQTPTNGGIITTTATVSASTPGTGNSSSGAPISGKRNTTPPNSGHGQSQSGATHSASVTPVPISSFTTNITVPLPDSSSAAAAAAAAAAAGAPMYAAFPQPLYPNMLPFAGPMATHPHPVAATAGTLVPTAASFHPHPPSSGSQHHGTASHHHPASAAGGESTPLSGGNGHHPHHSQYHHHQHHQHGGGGIHYSNVNGPSNGGGNSSSSSSSSNSSHSGGNHSNNCATNAPTPQSTPSTPLSLPMSMPSHHGGVPGATHKGMPLFPTPPIMPNVGGGGGYGGGHHHYGATDERKPGNGGYQGNKPRQPNANSGANGGSTGGSYFNYNASTNGGRQMTPNSNAGSGSYQPASGGGMKGSYAPNNTGNNNQNQNGPLILGPPPSGKGNRHDGTAPQSVTNANSNSSSKPPLIPTLPSMVVPGNTGMAGDKSRLNRSSKPPNLDLKRSYNSYSGVNNRNTPSTNSNESNGSPNSITSSSVHEHGASQSHHPMAPAHHAASHHHGGHGGNNHPSTPTAHHHGSNHPVVSAGGQPAQHGALHHHHHPAQHPHAQHHPHHGGNQPMPPGVQQQTHGGPGGGTGGTTHYYHPGGGQSMAPAGGGQPHSGQSSYYAGGAGNGPSQRGGSVGSNGGGNGGGSGSGANVGAHTTTHPHAMPAAVMHNSAVAAAAAAAAVEPYHQQLIPINAATGMSYVKIGQAYYPSLTLPQSRRSPPNEIRPIAGVYPTMNMVMPASRQFTPRPQHSTGYSSAKAAKSLR